MRMKRVNEGSSALLTVGFFDADDTPAVPQSVEYRIDCVETGEQIRDWVSLSPAPEISISLTAEDNASMQTGRSVEQHEVTVRAGYGSAQYLTDRYKYEVANLRFLVP